MEFCIKINCRFCIKIKFPLQLQIMFLIIVCLGNVLCWGQAHGGKVPINLEFSVSPIKDVYHPGDVITVDVYAYFYRELYEDEQNKEFLIIGKFTVGSIIHAFKSKPNNSVDKSILTITESTFSDTLIYLHDTSEEVHGSFKIVVQKEFVQLRLKASSFVLGEEYFNDKLISSSIIINGVKTHYIGHKFHKGYVIRPLKKIPKNDELNISDPQSQGYEKINSNSYQHNNVNRDLLVRYLKLRDSIIYFESGQNPQTVWCDNPDAGSCELVEDIGWVFHASGDLNASGSIWYIIGLTNYEIPFVIVDQYRLRGNVVFHEKDVPIEDPIFNNGAGQAWLRDMDNPNIEIRKVNIDVNGFFDFGNINILNPSVQINLIKNYENSSEYNYAIIEEDTGLNSDYHVKNRGLELFNPCSFPELWDHNGLITYKYQQFPVTEPEHFFYLEGTGLINKEENSNFCGGLHVMQQAIRFDSFTGIEDRSFFAIYVDNTIVNPFSLLQGSSCYSPAGSSSHPWTFDLVFIESHDLVGLIDDDPDQWDNSTIFHELAHAYHHGITGFNEITAQEHIFDQHSDLPTAYCEGLAHYISCVIKKETSVDEWDTIEWNNTTYSDPEWITQWKIVNGVIDEWLIVNLETINIPMPLTNGNTCEGKVALFLWDQYDDHNDEANYDRLSFGFDDGWTVAKSALIPMINITNFLNLFWLTQTSGVTSDNFILLATYHDLSFWGNTQRTIRRYPNEFPPDYTLQDAIDDETLLGDDDVLMLLDGVYTESVIIDRPIFLTSQFYDTGDINSIEHTILQGTISVYYPANFGSLIGLTITNGINLQDVWCIIQNCYIQDCNPGIAGDDSGVIVRGCLINNCYAGIFIGFNYDPPLGIAAIIYDSEFSENSIALGIGGESYIESCNFVRNENVGLGYVFVELKNSIIWGNENNYSGSLLDINYCDIEGGYAGNGNIDLDPLFVNFLEGDYHLTGLSPCIDNGDPASPLDPDDSRADIGRYYFEHENEDYFFIEPGWNWVSFPRLTEQGTVNLDIYEQAYYSSEIEGLLEDECGNLLVDDFEELEGKRNDTEISLVYYLDDFIDYGFDNELYRHEGYKLCKNKTSDPFVFIVDGDRIDSRSSDLVQFEQYWLGYYLPNSQNIEDAFGSNWVYVNIIWAEDWYYDRQNNNRGLEPTPFANSTEGKSLEYGKMYVVQMSENVDDFEWIDSGVYESPNETEKTEIFTYDEKADYEAIDILDIEGGENIMEIGVFEDEICVGAVVVDKYPIQILAYTTFTNRDPSILTFQTASNGRENNILKYDYSVYNFQTGVFENRQLISGSQQYSAVVLHDGDYVPVLNKVDEPAKKIL